MTSKEPEDVGEARFNCPHCDELGTQRVFALWLSRDGTQREQTSFELIECGQCGRQSLWDRDGEDLSYPEQPVPAVVVNLAPDEALRHIRIGLSIFGKAPEGSAAYMRYALIQVLKHLNCPHETIGQNIIYLVNNCGYDTNLLAFYRGLRSSKPDHDIWPPVGEAAAVVEAQADLTEAGVIDPRDGRDAFAALLMLITRILENAARLGGMGGGSQQITAYIFPRKGMMRASVGGETEA